MNLSTLFIKRPVATSLLTLAIIMAGAIAYTQLPVSSLPQVDFPTISVSASLPGASPKNMAASVASPLERALGSIAGVTEMTSSSSLGSTRITVQFDLNRDINGAARDVQAAINASLSNLPSGMPANPTYRQVNPADAPVLMISLTSEVLPPEKLYDLASTILAPKIAQVEGVGEVDVGGSSMPAVRVEINNDQLSSFNLSLESVRLAIADNNVNLPKGAIEAGGQHWQINANDQASSAKDYAPLIISWRAGAPVRLSDVATITDSVLDVRNSGSVNGEPAVVLLVYRKPGANVIKTVDAVSQSLTVLKNSIPSSVNLKKVFDSTQTIRSSLKEVSRTLYISIALVIMVVFLFLKRLKATFIPAMAVAASLIGALAGMYITGCGLDNLSLMALTIATGFVVDDAIVVLENISRHREAGLSALEAALTGAKEVSFTVLSISISLIAVFIPILFMGGIVGRLFREFAVTLSLAIIVSLILSLTLTPMLCAYLLNDKMSENKNNGKLDRLKYLYQKSLAIVLNHQKLTIGIWLLIVALNIFMYISIPKGFFPQQDTGRIMGALRADQSLSFQALRLKLNKLLLTAGNDPAVETVSGFTGSSGNSAFVSISLKAGRKKQDGADEVIQRLRAQLSSEPGVQLFLTAVQDIRVGGRSSRASYQYTLQSDDLDELNTWTPKLQAALRKDSIFKDLNNDQANGGLRALVTVDREAIGRLDVEMAQIDNALNDAFGQRQISTIYQPRNQYHVVMVAEKRHWQGPDGLASIYVTDNSGRLIPLPAMADFSTGLTPASVSHQGQAAAATISFNLDQGASLSEATKRLENIKRSIGLPANIQATFQGTAKAFQDSLKSQPLLILAAIVTLYIVLGVLYESLLHPVTILSTLPSAGIGALMALKVFGLEFSVIALIGVLLLAGIVKKNAILMIDFALEAERLEGLSPKESIQKACALRFRPIMMTTMSAILGAAPLAIGFGDGSELRQPLGISIIGGLIMSQLLTLYTTPVIYLSLDKLKCWVKYKFTTPRLASSINKTAERIA